MDHLENSEKDCEDVPVFLKEWWRKVATKVGAVEEKIDHAPFSIPELWLLVSVWPHHNNRNVKDDERQYQLEITYRVSDYQKTIVQRNDNNGIVCHFKQILREMRKFLRSEHKILIANNAIHLKFALPIELLSSNIDQQIWDSNISCGQKFPVIVGSLERRTEMYEDWPQWKIRSGELSKLDNKHSDNYACWISREESLDTGKVHDCLMELKSTRIICLDFNPTKHPKMIQFWKNILMTGHPAMIWPRTCEASTFDPDNYFKQLREQILDKNSLTCFPQETLSIRRKAANSMPQLNTIIFWDDYNLVPPQLI